MFINKKEGVSKLIPPLFYPPLFRLSHNSLLTEGVSILTHLLSGYLIPKTSRNLSDSTANREKCRSVLINSFFFVLGYKYSKGRDSYPYLYT